MLLSRRCREYQGGEGEEKDRGKEKTPKFSVDQYYVRPAVAFEDETDRTAADYHVLGVGVSPFGAAETTSESRSSASMATMTPPVYPGGGLLPSFSPGDINQPRALPTRPNSVNSFLPADSLVARPKLPSLNEAFLLRHFRKALGTWVCYLFSAISETEEKKTDLW